MARKMLRPYSFIFYFLTILLGFFLGLMYAGWIEAGKGQMLAAGAIVLGYGVLGSAIGLVVALAVAYRAHRRFIVGLNMVLALLMVGFVAYFMGKNQRQKKAEYVELHPNTQVPAKEMVPLEKGQPTETSPSVASSTGEPTDSESNLTSVPTVEPGQEIGLGLFAPDILSVQSLYFYRRPVTEWPPSAGDIVDSITFHIDENNNPAITTGPPWFIPEHQKVDYGILFMKIISEYRNSLEVVVNKKTGRTALILREPGRIVYWPEFILSVYSIELKNEGSQQIRIKPLDYAGEVHTKYNILRPVSIRADWVQVHLIDDNLKKIGEGWVRWRKDGKMLVKYSLLS